MKKEKPNPKSNRNILILTYLMVGLFACMVGYYVFFMLYQRENVINNSYNARLDSFAEKTVRGDIVSGDGRVLAVTRMLEDGTEQRYYPYDSLFAHTVGYADHGKTGIEALADFYLLSSHVNLLERAFHELSGQKSPGDRVVTTLDVELQQTAYAALGERKGAVVVLEPDTGRILAMVSKPDYNPNTLSTDWDALISGDNTQAQLLNRAAQGLYPPGSTYKIVTALEYIRENPDSFAFYHFDCDGVFEYESYAVKCYHSNSHGEEDLNLSFAKSCNGAFANIGLGLNLEQWQELNRELLFNSALPFSLPYSKSSYVMDKDAGTWEILQTSIGQGATQMSPLHNAMLTAAIANGGVLMSPYVIERVEDAEGNEVKQFSPAEYGSLMTAGEAAILGELMRNVVLAGTGSALDTDAYSVAGKTGSAEFETGKESHAWFTGYAPAENPEIVVTVIVEEGGAGGQVAAPIARSIMDVYFSR